MTILETDRLIIRQYSPADARLVMEHSRENGRRSELPDDALATVEDAASYITACLENDAADKYPLSYAIVLKDTDILIGEVQLCTIGKGIEISYSISENHAGNGYATEAVKAFAPWAKGARRLDAIYALVKDGNRASRKVLEHAGFAFQCEKKLVYYGREFMFREYVY